MSWFHVPVLQMLLQAIVPTAFAGYGDARDGIPSHADRETFFWTNVVRIDPEFFRDDYPCNFDAFSASEKTTKPLLLLNLDLNDAAFYHSDDMRRDGYFDHDSNDGTSWDRRIHRYYDGQTIGENIAYGYGSPYEAVVLGWMCSSGHRSNILSSGYNELGAGVSGTYYTQDFGFRSSAPDRGMASGIHLPQDPSGDVSFWVDWSGSGDPDALYVVVDGERVDLTRQLGTGQRGLWGVTVPAGSGCQAYYFVAEDGSRTETFPEDGSYGFGACSWDDADARWIDGQLAVDEPEPEPEDEDPIDDPDPTDDEEPTGPGATGDGWPDDTDEGAVYPDVTRGCGCASPGAPAGAPIVAFAVLSLAWRRRGVGGVNLSSAV